MSEIHRPMNWSQIVTGSTRGKNLVVKEILTTACGGITKQVEHYNLEMIWK